MWPLPEQVSSITVIRQSDRIALYADGVYLSSFFAPGNGVKLDKDYAIGAGEGGYTRFSGKITRMIVSDTAFRSLADLTASRTVPTVSLTPLLVAATEYPVFVGGQSTRSFAETVDSAAKTLRSSTTALAAVASTTVSSISVSPSSTIDSDSFISDSSSSTIDSESESAFSSSAMPPSTFQSTRSSMQSQDVVGSPANDPTKDSDSTLFIAIIGALLGVALILGVIVAVVLWRKKNKSRPTTGEDSDGTKMEMSMANANYGSSSFAIAID